MELYCDLEVSLRNVHLNRRNEVIYASSPAMIAVGRLSNERIDGEPEFAVVVHIPQCGSGIVYYLESLCEILALFATYGEATLRFEHPQHDLHIKTYPLELLAFLKALKSLLESIEGLMPSPMQLPSFSLLETEPTTDRHRDHPSTTSLPSSLRILRAIGYGFVRIDSRILTLKELQVLILSGNHIVNIPPALGAMNMLNNLSLNGNYLETLPAELFSEGMFPALEELNLSDNKLTSIPPGLSNLSKLKTLRLDINRLEQLPSDIGDLSELRLFTMAQNALQFLPGSFLRLHLECLDVCENPFQEGFQLFALERANPTLKELSAITILKHKLRVQDDDVPRCLKEYLKTGTKCSLCSSVFFKALVEVMCEFDLRAIAHCIHFPDDLQGGQRVNIPFRFKLCSTKCCVAFRKELESLR